jgi:hypothetical protein
LDDHATGPAAPAVVESFVKQLYITAKAVRLYPAASNIPRERAAALKTVLTAAQQRLAEVRLYFTSQGIYWEDLVVFPGKQAYVDFGREFYARNVDQVRFHVGATEQELTDFLGVLLMTPAELAQAGGFEAKLWDLGVSDLTVTEITARVIDTGVDLDAEAIDALASDALDALPDAAELDALLLGSVPKRPGTERVLLRVAADTAVVTSYLKATGDEDDTVPAEALAGARLAALARVAASEPAAEREAVIRSLVQALMMLAPGSRRAVVADSVLPGARKDEALAEIAGALTTDEIALAALEGFGPGHAEGAPEAAEGDAQAAGEAPDPTLPSRAYVTRVVRTLLNLGIHDDSSIRDSFARALLRKGMDPNAIAAALDDATEDALPAGPIGGRPSSLSADDELRVVEFAYGGPAAALTGERLAELREEARLGITDGEVFGTLVSLAVGERRPVEFDGTVALLQDGIAILVQGHHFEAASESADQIEQAADDETRPPEQRERLNALLGAMMSRESIGSVAAAMRLYPPESAEHEACRRLLDRFAGRAIDQMLDALAEEQDMVARKALVDALAESASEYVDALTRRVSDPRWYVVRNIVTVLGAAHDARTLPAMARAVRYPDPRVRREAIRALGKTPGEGASQLLIGALSDGDAANVQLAIRSLISRQYVPGLPALQAVALGEGTGNREVGPRAEAIEALGELGSPQSLPVLESLRRFRGLRALRRNRELTPAVDRAIAAIKARAAMPRRPGEGGPS